MKEMGKTNNGNVIVELTKDEFQALCELATITKGESLWDPFHMEQVDLTETFRVIKIFVTHQGYINLVSWWNRLFG